MSEIDQVFIGLAAYGEALAAVRAKRKERRRLATNARRRMRYASGVTMTPSSRQSTIEPEYDAPTSCYCHTSTMPPCGWCENGGCVEESVS